MAEHPGAAPFALGEPSWPRILLFHGLTGAPSELWPLGVGLARAGFRVEAPLLPGHGESPERLALVTATDVLQAARDAVERVRPVAIGGLSMGALLGLASATPAQTRILLLAPAARMAGSSRLFDALGRAPWPRALKATIGKGHPPATVGAGDALSGEWPAAAREAGAAALEAAPPNAADGRYARVPLRWSRELRVIRDAARAASPRLQGSALILHGLHDQTADSGGAVEVAGWLSGMRVSLRFLPRSPHLMPLGAERGRVAAEAARFLLPLLPPAGVRTDAKSA